MLRRLASAGLRQNRFAAQKFAKKQQVVKAVNVQFVNYATGEKAELNANLKSLLKPEVVKAIESKTDYDLIKKLNFLGQVIVRLNCATKLQLQALNAKTVFKTICQELPDPWDYYWLQVQENGNDPEKWRSSMLELVDTIPVLVERCFRTMTVHGVYPDPHHYNILIQSFGKIGDSASAHFWQDDMIRCATEKRDKKNVEAWRHILDSWLNSKNWAVGHLVHKAALKRGASLTPEQLEKIDKLKASYDSKAGFDYIMGVTQIKPQYIKDMEDTVESNVQNAIKQAVDNIQPSLDKLVAPEELIKRKASAEAKH